MKRFSHLLPLCLIVPGIGPFPLPCVPAGETGMFLDQADVGQVGLPGVRTSMQAGKCIG